MLELLHIRNFVIVDEAHIHFHSGFSVFSGETGAGKSILIDALSLALGARAEQGFVREGAERTEITAIFTAGPSVRQWLDDQGMSADAELILRRTIDANNRSRAFINGTPTTLGQLRNLSALLVDIHGQHAHQSLLRTSTHADLLDEQGQHQSLAQATRTAWRDWQSLQQKLTEARERQAQVQTQLEHLEWQIEQLQALDLAADEWEQMTAEHDRLAHAQTLMDELSQALELLESSNPAASSLLHQANQHVEKAQAHDPALGNINQNLTTAHIACTEAISELNSYLSAVEMDPARLHSLEQRMSQAFDLARRFDCQPEELPQIYTDLQEQYENLQDTLDIEALSSRCAQAKQSFYDQAQKLSAARQKTASYLTTQVTATMQELAMEGGRFEVRLKECPPYAGGCEQVEFLVAAHAGSRPGPLAKVASGGELARISLALSVIASEATRVPTLIFDEVDTGIGGAVAEVVGRLLAELGQKHQVLCVTHLAQVAARAAHHYQVSKHTHKAQTLSKIQQLETAQRVDELARMMGGLTITHTTKKHAREMLGLDQSASG